MNNISLFNISVLFLCTNLLVFEVIAQSSKTDEEKSATGEYVVVEVEEPAVAEQEKKRATHDYVQPMEEEDAVDDRTAVKKEKVAAENELAAVEYDEAAAKKEKQAAKEEEKAAQKELAAAEEEDAAKKEKKTATENKDVALDDEEAATEDGQTTGCAGEEEQNVAAFLKNANELMRGAIDKCRQAQWANLLCGSEETKAEVKATRDEYNELYAELRTELVGMLQTYPDYNDQNLAYWVRIFLYAIPSHYAETSIEFHEKTDKLIEIQCQPIFCPYGISDDPGQCNLTSADFNGLSQWYIEDYEEILYNWQTPKDTLGTSDAKTLYTDIVGLWQTAAEQEGYSDAMSLDLDNAFLDPVTGRDDMLALWEEMKDLYADLLFYMNSYMVELHQDSFTIDEFGLTPGEFYATHPVFFGFMPNQTNPYYKCDKRVVLEDVIVEQGRTPIEFAQYADDLFVSMGFEAMRDNFWENSYFEAVEGQSCNDNFVYRLDKDRIYVGTCAYPAIEILQTVYHKISAVKHFMVMDEAAVTESFNIVDFFGWQNSISESISPILLSPSYLAHWKIVTEDTHESTFLYYMFQEYTLVIPRMAYAMATQLWIWQVFNGETTPENYNCDLYKLMAEFEGMRPPQPRDTNGFDAVTREMLIRSHSYVDWLFGYVAKFQIFKAMCQAAGHEGPLYTCNLYDSKEAGDLLKSLMTPGVSIPFKDLFQEVLGAPFDVSGIKEYFSPIIDVIAAYNDEQDNRIPWTVEGAETVLCAPCAGTEEE